MTAAPAPPPIYAEAGEIVTCENGHRIARLARDIVDGDVIVPEQFDEAAVALVLGALAPPCPRCGALWAVGACDAKSGVAVRGGSFHFSAGWRIRHGGRFYDVDRIALGAAWPPSQVRA